MDRTRHHAGTDSSVGGFPLPGTGGPAAVAVPAPDSGHQRWAGAPSAHRDTDRSILLAYRVRAGEDHNVVARSADGVTFTTLTVLTPGRLGAAMVERPALVRTGSGAWRLYVSCATPGSKHWWVGVVEAATPEGLGVAPVTPVFEGDRHTAVKDPVIRRRGDRWEAWLCCHPLDEPGEEDRMSTAYATSRDGLRWQWHGTVLTGRPGAWDARGARLTSVLPDGRAAYDGRASAEENWRERTGVAAPCGAGHGPGSAGDTPLLAPVGDAPACDVRYLEALPAPGGGYRIYYEARLPAGSHELRTETVPAPGQVPASR
ncbi:hypothetical protein DB35_05540 [Streptomyces abyssalis]|uniref:Glycosyl hydrolase family 32 N-terminal domain-containing protein n=1 Tax=Streptomyces abyssalis TaxID=933944 RepID=A0A1E7JTJ0_9ACTN|nr:hypothetical protein [Streptomyces abyssalis]OEU92171.1 hypothetical protein AN215_07200 [Streptomyces abyssalis]OEU94548.1 hypothetical protein DB35_05540 [Streptomyces abyssalis]